MKKVLFFLAILIVSLISVNGQTNVYHKFPTHDAVWLEEYHNYIPQTTNISCAHYQLEIAGDTLIGSHQYHNIRSRGYFWDYGYCGNPYYTPTYFNEYWGSIREDTVLKKVFLGWAGHTIDTLLYDFDLHLGDTCLPTYLIPPFTNYIVTLVDSVLIGSEYHKRFGLSGNGFGGPETNFVYLIEGIGSTFGLLSPIHTAWEVPDGSSLECFMMNGASVYPNSGNNCSLLSVSENGMAASSAMQIFPNPFTTSTQITVDKTYHNVSLSVYDIQGKLMLQTQYADCSQIQLNRNRLSNGMYFLKLLLDERWVETGKIVVSD